MHRTHDASIAPVSGAFVTPSRTKNPDGGASFASQNICKLLSPLRIQAMNDKKVMQDQIRARKPPCGPSSPW